jgi:hypothetical protein
MSNVAKVISSRNAKSDFRILLGLFFCLVAMSFFAVGFLYAQAPAVAILINSLMFVGVTNACMLYYLFKKFNAISYE